MCITTSRSLVVYILAYAFSRKCTQCLMYLNLIVIYDILIKTMISFFTGKKQQQQKKTIPQAE